MNPERSSAVQWTRDDRNLRKSSRKEERKKKRPEQIKKDWTMMMMMEENGSIKSAVSSMGAGDSTLTLAASAASETHDVNPTVSVRIYVPELNVQKVIHFHREELVWNVKQQCLATLPKVSPSWLFSFLSFPMTISELVYPFLLKRKQKQNMYLRSFLFLLLLVVFHFHYKTAKAVPVRLMARSIHPLVIFSTSCSSSLDVLIRPSI